MSEHHNEDTLPISQDTTSTTPARKSAAKKTAAKKSAVKKVAAKKTTARKAKPAEPELPFDPAPAEPAPKPTRARKAAKTAKIAKPAKSANSEPPSETPAPTPPTAPTPKTEPQAEPPAETVRKIPRATRATRAPKLEDAPEDERRRYGRVPGGGPTREEVFALPLNLAPPSDQPREPQREPSQHPQEQNFQNRPPQNHGQGQPPQYQPQGQNNDQGQRESRSKRRREKRKRRRDQGGNQDPRSNNDPRGNHDPRGNFDRDRNQDRQPDRNRDRQRQPYHQGQGQGPNGPNGPNGPSDFNDRRIAPLSGPKTEVLGMLELAPKGFGFLRLQSRNFEQAREDIFVTPEIIRRHNLRVGQWINGLHQEGPRGPQLVEVSAINGMPPEEAAKLPHFEELKAINPTKRISFETTPDRYTTRVIDIMAPVGRGQRGLIVSPPRSGKTTLLLHMAEAVREKYDEAIHLMVLLVDERPEEVTEFRRTLPGAEIYASSNDEGARNHCRIAELAIERAKRLVEAGKDVFLLMDSITRLARAYNGNMNQRGRGTGSGGITIGALEVPRRLFAAARNTRGGGSLTILATALIQTNSRADEAIFLEFKGTGNMELVLDRKIAENYIYPAVDIFKSGTRREELLLADHMLHKIHLIRRGLSGHRPVEAMERLLFFLKKFPNNPQMLLEIKG
jgi:transcription termination factor Rho